MAEIEDNTKKWKDTPCLWIRKIKSILLKKKKTTHRNLQIKCNPYRNTKVFFTELE